MHHSCDVLSCIYLYINPYISFDVSSHQDVCYLWNCVFNSSIKPDPGSGLRTCSICPFQMRKRLGQIQLENTLLRAPFWSREMKTLHKLLQTQNLQGHLARLIAQCWQHRVLIEAMFISWMRKKKRGGSGGSVPWCDTAPSIHKHYLRAMFYAHLSEATNKNKTHVHLAWLFCILLYGKQSPGFFQFLLRLCNSPV